jgi:transcriptional regulator CtsR
MSALVMPGIRETIEISDSQDWLEGYILALLDSDVITESEYETLLVEVIAKGKWIAEHPTL